MVIWYYAYLQWRLVVGENLGWLDKLILIIHFFILHYNIMYLYKYFAPYGKVR